MFQEITDREKLLRRVALKCADFARQLSYHRALERYEDSRKLNFWRYMYNNAIDLAVIDWFHLFGYHNDDLHWKQVSNDVDGFREELLAHLRMGQKEWVEYRETVKTYRDKDVAHIQVRPLSHVPDMSIALKATNFYYKKVLEELKQYSEYKGWPADLGEYHKCSFEQSIRIAEAASSATSNIDEKVY